MSEKKERCKGKLERRTNDGQGRVEETQKTHFKSTSRGENNESTKDEPKEKKRIRDEGGQRKGGHTFWTCFSVSTKGPRGRTPRHRSGKMRYTRPAREEKRREGSRWGGHEGERIGNTCVTALSHTRARKYPNWSVDYLCCYHCWILFMRFLDPHEYCTTKYFLCWVCFHMWKFPRGIKRHCAASRTIHFRKCAALRTLALFFARSPIVAL